MNSSWVVLPRHPWGQDGVDALAYNGRDRVTDLTQRRSARQNKAIEPGGRTNTIVSSPAPGDALSQHLST